MAGERVQCGRDDVLGAGGDEEGLLAAVAEAVSGVGVFVFREEPEADGNLSPFEAEREKKRTSSSLRNQSESLLLDFF